MLMYLNQIKKIIPSPETEDKEACFERFRETAINLEWIKISQKHFNWFNYPTGINVTLYEFPEGYIQGHFIEALVRCLLCNRAYADEWNADFWDIPKRERMEICGATGLYTEILLYNEPRLQPVAEEHLRGEIEWFCWYNNVRQGMVDNILQHIKGVEIVDLGGCYSLDHEYIAIGDNNIMFVSCGIWD